MFSYLIDEEQRLVISRGWDRLTSADILKHRRQLKSDTRFHRDFFQLVDFTNVTDIALNYKDVEELTREHMFSRKSRRAFVAPSPLAYGMSRMFIGISEFSGRAEMMEVFKTRDRALRFLLRR